MAHRTLIKGGTVITVDPAFGDLPVGDVLVEGADGENGARVGGDWIPKAYEAVAAEA